MKSVSAWTALAALAALACQESNGPAAPQEDLARPVAAAAACPCWDEATLATAFPAAHGFLSAGGTAALTRFDLENAQQVQALVQFGTEGPGACELATFGTGGLVEVLAGAAGLSPEQCEACAAFLEGPAAAHGFLVRPADGEIAE